MNALNAYIPNDRRFALSAGVPLPERSRCSALRRYPRLHAGAEPLARLPNRSADELAAWLERPSMPS
jgi:hypothetical protein